MKIDLKELEYFKIVCEQKSITKAARYLYMSQQGLSKVIKNIENELNTTLLIRKASGIELTQTGAYLACQQSASSCPERRSPHRRFKKRKAVSGKQ